MMGSWEVSVSSECEHYLCSMLSLILQFCHLEERSKHSSAGTGGMAKKVEGRIASQ